MTKKENQIRVELGGMTHITINIPQTLKENDIKFLYEQVRTDQLKIEKTKIEVFLDNRTPSKNELVLSKIFSVLKKLGILTNGIRLLQNGGEFFSELINHLSLGQMLFFQKDSKMGQNINLSFLLNGLGCSQIKSGIVKILSKVIPSIFQNRVYGIHIDININGDNNTITINK